MRPYLLVQWHYVRDDEGGIAWDYEKHCEKKVVVKTERFATQEKAYSKAIKSVGRSRHIQTTLYCNGVEDNGWDDNCHVGYLLYFPPAGSKEPERVLRFQHTTWAALTKTAELLRWDGYSIIPVME